ENELAGKKLSRAPAEAAVEKAASSLEAEDSYYASAITKRSALKHAAVAALEKAFRRGVVDRQNAPH
ncbi:MAG: hypothetical protein QXN59_02810, partial [Candidatus Micrarchaeaceae archaeon]